MTGFLILLQKEWKEQTRNFKDIMDSTSLYYFWNPGAYNESLSAGNHEECWQYA